MAKKEQVERVRKGKTPAQLAKKAENERKAAERLAKLQADQKRAQELRQQGFQGNDYTILKKFEDERKAALEAEKKAIEDAALKEKTEKQKKFKEQIQANQRKYVEETLAGPSGQQYKEWLNNKPATFKNCETFLKLSGLPRTPKDVVINPETPVINPETPVIKLDINLDDLCED